MRAHLKVSLIKSKTGLVSHAIGYVIYEDRKLPYSIITKKNLKNFYIEISPTKGVIVKNPNFNLQKVQALVDAKAKWIFEKTTLIQQRHSIQNIYENEKKILLFGAKESLHVKSLEAFYKDKTKEVILQLVDKYSSIMGLSPTAISFRKTKRRWGSCSGKNALSFNSSIAQLPLQAIEYIVVHELSHIKHKHHQKAFWQLVAKFHPLYKESEKIIKSYSPSFS